MEVGDFLKDNDPRMGYRRALKIIAVEADHVKAVDSFGRTREYKKTRIYTDGKIRKSGMNLIRSN